jgi:hypothetical protein
MARPAEPCRNVKHSTDAVGGALRRMLANGPMTQLPMRPSDLEILMALGAARFEPGRRYRESEINEILKAWLGGFFDPAGTDHVTLRRSLVDARLIRRDRAGEAYEVDLGALEALLGTEARAMEPSAVLENIRQERAARKRGVASPG